MVSTLYRSGSIHAPHAPRATALLVDSSSATVVWVGTDEAARRLTAPDVEVDLGGRLVAPAFVDAWTVDAGPGELRAAASAGIGSVQVAFPVGAGPAGIERSPVELTYYDLVNASRADRQTLTDVFVERTRTGAQAAVVVQDHDGLECALRAARAAVGVVGLPPLVGARHRLQVVRGLTEEFADELARLGLVVVLAGAGDGPWSAPPPLRALAAAGVPFTFGTGTEAGPAASPAPWEWVRRASGGGAGAVSVRAAFAAATRGGHRAARIDTAGQLRPGAPATFAVWEFDGELVVRSPDGRVAAWSTDPRAATPGLPDLERGREPRCRLTVVRGRVAFSDDWR